MARLKETNLMTQTKFLQLIFVNLMIVSLLILTGQTSALASPRNCQSALVPSNFLFREVFENFDKGFVKDEPYLYTKATPRLEIGPLKEADRTKMLAILSAPSQNKFMVEPDTHESIFKDLAHMNSELHATDVSLRFVSAIYKTDTNELIGAFWLSLFPSTAGASISYVIAHEYKNLGYASEVVSGVVEDLVHSAYPFEYLFAVANEHNVASVRTLTKNGFSKHSSLSNQGPFSYYIKFIGR
jgi:RimJ/RimL family protein N-acetyltransferase